MLNMGKIGGFIAYLRREKDMTQVELADRLSVSHQAVSKWERGESMPDIGTLPLLARELDVSTDALLAGEIEETENGKKVEEFVQALAEGQSEKAGEMIESGDVDVSVVVDVAPVIRTSTMRQLALHMEQTQLSMHDVTALAPFLDRELLERLLEQTNLEWNWDQLHKLAPFVSRATLQRSVEELAAKEAPTRRGLLRLAPFMDRSHLEELIGQLEDADWDWHSLTTLAPFVHRETLQALVEDAAKQEPPSMSNVRKLGPFLDRQLMNDFVQNVPPEEWDWSGVASIAPFVHQAVLSRIATRVMTTLPDAHQLARIAPFLDRTELGRLMERLITARSGVDRSTQS